METPQLAVCQEPVNIPLLVLVNEVIHAPCGTQILVNDFALPLVELHKVPISPFLQTGEVPLKIITTL